MPIATLLPKAGTVGAPTAPTAPTSIIAAADAIFAITSCGTTTQELYDALLPLAYADALQSNALWKFCCSIAGTLQDVEDLARDDGDRPGWADIVDLSVAPSSFLDWLGQFVGVQPVGNLTDAQKRQRIANKEGFKRGSVPAMRSAAQVYLTGSKTVNLYERDTSPYHITVNTYTAETPDSAAVQRALISQKPAGIVLTYTVTPGQTWGQMMAAHATWTLVNSFYSNWNEVVNDTP
jgi:hypothetical protein